MSELSYPTFIGCKFDKAESRELSEKNIYIANTGQICKRTMDPFSSNFSHFKDLKELFENTDFLSNRRHSLMPIIKHDVEEGRGCYIPVSFDTYCTVNEVQCSTVENVNVQQEKASSSSKTSPNVPFVFIILIHLLLLHDFGSAARLHHKQTDARESSRYFPNVNHEYPHVKFIEDLIVFSQKNSIRSRRSASSCNPLSEPLLDLVNYTYLLATSGYQRIHTKRNAPRRFQLQRSWGGFCLQMHQKVNEMYCQSHRKQHLFGNDTDDLQASLRSMSNFLQQEMNNLDISYTSLSRSTCAGYIKYSGYALKRKIINELYDMKIRLQQECSLS